MPIVPPIMMQRKACGTTRTYKMNKKKKDDVQLTPIEELIKEDFGAEGTVERTAFETGVDAFILGECLKEERKK